MLKGLWWICFAMKGMMCYTCLKQRLELSMSNFWMKPAENLAFCLPMTRILVSLTFLQRKISAGILLMRFVSEKSSVKANLLQSILKTYGHRLVGSFTVVSESKVRIRPLR